MHTPTHLTKTLTLTTLTTLILTGCGQQETTTTPDETPTTTTTATSTQTTSTNQDSSRTEATAEATQNYSGGSKAPDAEYRPADELGPAQNVPVPKRPEGMNMESAEGLEKFLGYWVESVNYGTQTGNFVYALPLVDENHISDIEYFAWTEDLYDHGGWKAGGLRSVVLDEGLLVNQGDGIYTWGGNLIVQDSYTYYNGEMNYMDNSETQTEGIFFKVEFRNNQWFMHDVEIVEVSQ